MSRRPAQPPMTRLDVARSRMAPGGRMWSESPIRYPRRRTAVAGVPLQAVPTAAYVWGLPKNNADPITMPSLDGYSQAVVFAAAVGVTGVTVPDGWRLLGEGSLPTGTIFVDDFHWAVLCIDNAAGGESTALQWSPLPGAKQSYHTAHGAWFTGGVGGRWSLAVGNTQVGATHAPFLAASAAPAWCQWVGMAGVYSGLTLPAGCSTAANNAPATAASHPAAGAYSGTDFQTTFPNGAPIGSDTACEWGGTSGVYGVPGSIPVAATWQ